MRILLVVPHDEEIGGVASVVRNLAAHLSRNGHHVLFFHPTASVILKRKTTRSGFTGFELRLQMPFGDRHPAISLLVFVVLFPASMCQLMWLILSQRINLVNIHYPADLFVYFAVCRYLLPFRLVLSIHGADVLCHGKPRPFYTRPFTMLFQVSDLIVAPSATFRRQFVSAFDEFACKSIFIHNGINLAEFEKPLPERSETSRAPYLLCISAYKEEKAIETLIRAFKNIADVHSSVRLILVGTGPLLDSFKKLAEFLDIGERIEFAGSKPRIEVPGLIRGCEVFVLPSRFETFGIVLLEAMACKKPVVSTTAGGIPEIIEDGKSGILVKPDDPQALAEAILKVLNSVELQRTLGENAYARIRNRFLSDSTGSSYERVFTRLPMSASSHGFL